jgi:hypothetical protein
MKLLAPTKKPGIFIEPAPSGARVLIRDAQGNECGGNLDNDALRYLGRRCLEVANRQHPNRIIMPTGG